ncbi:MAG TPA: hypothetical protein VFT82_01895 [Candidatus Paceibacterota bacterium]|nr:hypothetical protein [Candidatus Paceibacterota bacterium]
MKKNISLIVAIALPLIFLAAVAIAVLVPAASVHPTYSFIYTSDPSYYGYYGAYRSTYIVNNGSIALQSLPTQPNMQYRDEAPPIYLYDVKTDTTHVLTLDQAHAYSVDPGPSSPDGYIVQYEYGNNGIFDLFGARSDSNGYFIEKGSAKKKLPGLAESNGYSYNGSFKLLGWIK